MKTTDTFDPSAVAVGAIAPDGAFADVTINTIDVRLAILDEHGDPVSWTRFTREVASADEGTNSYVWRRVS